MKETLALTSLGLSIGLLSAANLPTAELANGEIRVKIHLPDAKKGYYRGTRFDWSGVVYSLQYQGHDYYGPWFNKTDPNVHDFIYDGSDIVAGPCSAITGPVDEFKPLGWDEAKPGGTFIKIGIGALRKPDDKPYDNYRLYEIADHGKWAIKRKRSEIEFVQTLSDASSGYGYVYRKTIRLAKGKPEMVLEHQLKNTGAQVIETSVYNHNFLVLDGKPPGSGFAITVPFQIDSPHPPDARLAEIRGNQIVYLKTLENRDVATAPLHGFADRVEDNEIRLENSETGMRIVADRPLLSLSLWSIRTVVAIEPFIAISIEPGKEFSWKSRYTYETR